MALLYSKITEIKVGLGLEISGCVNYKRMADTLLVGILFFVIALLYFLFPPKKVNALYGYRTSHSMKNEDIFQAANKKSASLFLYLGSILLLIGLVSYLTEGSAFLPIQTGILLGGLAWVIWRTEVYLHNHFDKEGNRK